MHSGIVGSIRDLWRWLRICCICMCYLLWACIICACMCVRRSPAEGHAVTLQDRYTALFPVQKRPLFRGGGLLQRRYANWTPPPHEREHEPHGPQELQLPWFDVCERTEINRHRLMKSRKHTDLGRFDCIWLSNNNNKNNNKHTQHHHQQQPHQTTTTTTKTTTTTTHNNNTTTTTNNNNNHTKQQQPHQTTTTTPNNNKNKNNHTQQQHQQVPHKTPTTNTK